MFSPLLKDNKCYCDGGIIKNYPLEKCINSGVNPDEILGLRRVNIQSNVNSLNETSSLLDFIMIIINNYAKRLLVLNNDITIKNEYIVESEPTTLLNMYSVLNNIEERIQLINIGINMVKPI
jgi:hypothetical protein